MTRNRSPVVSLSDFERLIVPAGDGTLFMGHGVDLFLSLKAWYPG